MLFKKIFRKFNVSTTLVILFKTNDNSKKIC